MRNPVGDRRGDRVTDLRESPRGSPNRSHPGWQTVGLEPGGLAIGEPRQTAQVPPLGAGWIGAILPGHPASYRGRPRGHDAARGHAHPSLLMAWADRKSTRL